MTSGHRNRLRGVAIGLALSCPLALAHNTAVIHPDYTLRAIEVLLAAFPDQYPEIAEFQGTLLPATRPHNVTITNIGQVQAIFEDIADYEAGPRDNIVSGVVLEDEAINFASQRVFEHFFHARSGVPLLDNGLFRTSAITARELFSQSINVYGDSEQSRQQAYFLFGRALHHVEDMSSPAHVHNDAHVPRFGLDVFGGFPWNDEEHDDFEGRWLPLQLWNFNDLATLLGQATNVQTIDSWDDVWGAADTALSGLMFNRTVYLNTLDYPDDEPPVNINGSGELTAMFPCDSGDRPENCLHHEQDVLFAEFQWTIDSIGEFNYQAIFHGTTDDWWPIAFNDEDPGTSTPDGVQGEYYLEQVIPGVPEWDLSTNVIPNQVRASLEAPWHPVDNPMQANADDVANSIVNLRAENLVVPAVEYAAGFVKWWADIVNPPPILRSLTISQGGEEKYSGTWQDDPEEPRATIELNELFLHTTPVAVTDIPARQLNRGATLKHFNDQADIEMIVEFSERVDPFSIEILIEIEGQDHDLLQGSFSLIDLGAGDPDPDEVNRRWQIVVPQANLAAVPASLNGKLPLVFRANDIDVHWGDTGAALDGTPQTPARRHVPEDQMAEVDYAFPWHDQTTTGIFGNVGENAYDHAGGDRNHVLLFDTQAPTSTLQVD